MFRKGRRGARRLRRVQEGGRTGRSHRPQVRSEVLVVHVRELAYTGGATWDPEWAPEVEAFMAELVRRLTAQGRPASSEILEAPEGHEGMRLPTRRPGWAPTSSSWAAGKVKAGWGCAGQRCGQCHPPRFLPGPRGQVADRGRAGRRRAQLGLEFPEELVGFCVAVGMSRMAADGSGPEHPVVPGLT
jgi:hypothetical protein